MILLTEHIYDFNLDVALKKISKQRREYALRYHREIDQRLSVKAYLLLCSALNQLYGIEQMPIFGYSPKGKPYLRDYPDIHFNISHCEKAILCAVEKQTVGVDIETIKPYNEELARYTMNNNEIEQINRSYRPDIEFARLWTMKEAVLKKSGKGITTNIKDVLSGCEWEIDTFVSPNNDYVYSICK